MPNRDFPENATCPLCGGEIKNDEVVRAIDLKPGTLVINDVPAGVCELCGERWFVGEVSKKLDLLVSDAKARGVQLEVVSYSMVRIEEPV